MAPVLAIPGMVADCCPAGQEFDPVGEIFKPIATGPSLVHLQKEETEMAPDKKLLNRKQRKELVRRMRSEDPGLEVVP